MRATLKPTNIGLHVSADALNTGMGVAVGSRHTMDRARRVPEDLIQYDGISKLGLWTFNIARVQRPAFSAAVCTANRGLTDNSKTVQERREVREHFNAAVNVSYFGRKHEKESTIFKNFC
jgi:hypothetical protein